MKLSVIIPALNEAAVLPRLLDQLQAQQGVQLEIIVCDGGSSDTTSELAESAGAVLLRTARGRGAQMNAGAGAARGELLLFLHADSELPAITLLRDALAEYETACTAPMARKLLAGHFALRFIREYGGHDYLFRYMEGKTRLSRPYTINGDQGLLIARADFHQLGGYDQSLPFLEDQRLAAKIFAQGRWVLLPGLLLTSARRFETEGHSARYTLMAMLMGLHYAGIEEFFTLAPEVYREQASSAKLALSPFHALARRVLAARGRWRSLRAIGPFIRHNTWQLFYAVDVARRAEALPALRWYERHLERRLENVFWDSLAAALLGAWFYLWLPLTMRR